MGILELTKATGHFLLEDTKKDDKNSSKPPSQVEKDETSTVSGTHCKGLSESDDRFANSRTIETVEIAPVATCATCGEDLRQVPSTGHERRTRIDIVFEKVVEHVDAQIKECDTCQATTKGEFAADLSGPVQYGLGIKAYIMHWAGAKAR